MAELLEMVHGEEGNDVSYMKGRTCRVCTTVEGHTLLIHKVRQSIPVGTILYESSVDQCLEGFIHHTLL